MLTTDPDTLPTTARALNTGSVAIIPTDTVYGIAAHPAHPKAVARIRTIKGRAFDKPVALLVADEAAIIAFGADLPPAARNLARAYWPGALTLVLPCGAVYEGFRVPDHPFLHALLQACGGTLRVTSANLSGQMPALSAVTALQDVGLAADLVVDGGVSPGGVPSTVVRVNTNGSIDILRPGAIPADAIMSVAGFSSLGRPH